MASTQPLRVVLGQAIPPGLTPAPHQEVRTPDPLHWASTPMIPSLVFD